MKMKLRAAVGSLLISAAVAGAAVVPAASSAHGNTGSLCWGNIDGGSALSTNPGGTGWIGSYLGYGEPFRIKETILFGGQFWSFGHSASTYPADYWVLTPTLRCDHPPV